MAIMDRLQEFDVYSEQAIKQASLIQNTSQGPMNDEQYETSMWELKKIQEKASKWTMQLGDALVEVLELIHRFKVGQQKEGLGHGNSINLDDVQEKCDSLERLLGRLYQLVNTLTDCLARLGQRFGENHPNDGLKQMINNIDKLWQKLLQSSMVIEKHPPQVIRTHQCFKTEVRLLLSSLRDKVIPSLSQASKSCPKVAVYLMYELQALELQRTLSSAIIKDNQLKPVKSKDETGCFQYDATTKRLTASFKKLVVEKVTRTSVRGNDKVSEEKLTLLFRVEGTQLQSLQTMSLPIVITVHANQEMDGEATIIWDNAFRILSYCPHFVQPCTLSSCVQACSIPVPVKVPWLELAPILRLYFKTKVDCDFSDDDMEHLREKIFRGSSPSEELVSWRDFAKNHLPGKEHTFWGWFRGLIRVMELHDGVIARMWRNKLIMGLITSSTSLRLLSGYPVGTFVLRPSSFQEYFCADVLAVKGPTRSHHERKEYIRTISYISKEYPKKSLADCVLEVAEMIYILTPTSNLAHPKRDVLAEYIKKGKEAESLPTGYEAVVTVCTVSKTPGPVAESPSLLRTKDAADSTDMEVEPATSSLNSVASPEYTIGAPAFPPQSGPSVAQPGTTVAHLGTSVCSSQLRLSIYPPQSGSGVYAPQSGLNITYSEQNVAHQGTTSLSAYSSDSGSSAFSPLSDTNAFSPQSERSVFSPQPTLLLPQSGSNAFLPQSGSSVFSAQVGFNALPPLSGSSLFSPQPGPSVFSSQSGPSVFSPQSGPSAFSQSGSCGFSPQPETILSPQSGNCTLIQQNIDGLPTGFSIPEVSFDTTLSALPCDSRSPVLGTQNREIISTEQNRFQEIPPSTSEDILSLWDDALIQ